MHYIQMMDNTILNFIQNNMHNKVLDKIMIAITSMGNMGLIWIIISIALIINKKYRKVGVYSLIALILVTVLGEGILKHLFERPRPCVNIPQSQLLIKKPTSYSFPSGHSGSSFACAVVLSYYFKKYAVLIYGFATTIAFSRLYVYVHYPSDVLVGTILGLLSGFLVVFMWKKSEAKKNTII